MICFTLRCYNGHEYDAWFRDSESYAKQQDMNLVVCPHCGICEVEKALMAPNLSLSSKKTGPILSPELLAKQTLRDIVDFVASQCEDVGDQFSKEARAIHNDESPRRPICGTASPEEARELLDDGIDLYVMPRVTSDS